MTGVIYPDNASTDLGWVNLKTRTTINEAIEDRTVKMLEAADKVFKIFARFLEVESFFRPSFNYDNEKDPRKWIFHIVAEKDGKEITYSLSWNLNENPRLGHFHINTDGEGPIYPAGIPSRKDPFGDRMEIPPRFIRFWEANHEYYEQALALRDSKAIHLAAAEIEQEVDCDLNLL